MSELVLIIPDLYLGARSIPPAGRGAGGAHGSLPALASVARFGAARALPEGWRAWVASRLGRADLASVSPAAVAAAGPWTDGTASAVAAPAADFVWFADPVHLLAGMTSVHLAPGGVLSLDARTQAELRAGFDESFAPRGYRLAPTRAGRFIASGPRPAGEVSTTEPARSAQGSLAEAMPRGPSAAALLAVGAEIEMWLHDHPVNRLRSRAGLPPISTLWLWGGGPRLGLEAGSRARTGDAVSRSPGDRSSAAGSRTASLFSDDAYMAGLAHLAALRIAGGPRIAGGARALEQLAVDEAPCRIVTLALHGDAVQTLETFDREWVSPALDLLARRRLGRLTLILNDRVLTVAAADRIRIWRRRRDALEALR